MKRLPATTLALLGLLAPHTPAQPPPPLRTFAIPNQLGLSWPGELVSFELPAAELPDGPLTITIQEQTSPTQVERLPDQRTVRLWTLATIAAQPGQKNAPAQLEATLARGQAETPFHVQEHDDHYLIANGLYEFRLRKYAGKLPAPTTLGQLPHWVVGMRVAGTDTWDGRAWFESNAPLLAARTELLHNGPVFADFRIVYDFDCQPDGQTETLPLALGKQTFRWPPGQPPRETVAKRPFAYEMIVRFVANDPWIDINERFHFPRDPQASTFGVHQYFIHWGQPVDLPAIPGFANATGMPVDTVTWVRWFEYDTFGGNIDQNYLPAQPRPAQKGRPFALLRPRWNQGGGGAQDFFLTSGGPHTPDHPADLLDRPAAGIVAAYASKWIGPYPNTIAAYAYDGNRGRCRFPLTDGERSDMHYGQRAYGLCLGTRRAFTSLNQLVRRHTDWTLDAQINHYTLDWKRTDQARQLYERRLAAGDINPKLKPPSAQLFIQRRYQDDFLNPTQRMTRNLKDFVHAPLYDDRGEPRCGPWQAAMGYIFTDLDHWIGWLNGWNPGNPNFHTDKYMGAIYAAAAMPDHPHAQDWLAFGRANFADDQNRVLFPPDGVGFECPGYSGYSMNLQLSIARTLLELGAGNAVADNPLYLKSAHWHRKLLTPVDPRLGFRHEAPHGDTHRWNAGLGHGFGDMAGFLHQSNPAAAAEMLAVYRLLATTTKLKPEDLQPIERRLAEIALQPAKLDQLDWTSQAFEGFGAIMRTHFGSDRETFLSFKAGHARGHYHNDELAYHYYCGNTPISLDYNCSYHPRGDHAALHNSMTFGNAGTLKHNGKGYEFEAMEQLGSNAKVIAFESTPELDWVTAERQGNTLTMTPVDPHDAEFNREYPTRHIPTLVHRRTLALVKHPPQAAFTDYIVVRDQISGDQPGQINIHLLARELDHDGHRIDATGQWDKDMVVFFAGQHPPKKIDQREWFYDDEWMLGPGQPYEYQPGESMRQWADRLHATPNQRLPAPDWKPTWQDPREPTSVAWREKIRATRGRALMPPPGWQEKWLYGECQLWLRAHLEPGADTIWILYPYPRTTQPPTVEAVDQGLRITLGKQSETVTFTNHAPQLSR